MSHRRILAVLTACVLVLSGCGSDKAAITTPSAKPTASEQTTEPSESSEAGTTPEPPSTETGPQQTLDGDACVDLTSANLNLALASTREDAQKEADVFAQHNPPPDVQEAIDHFVGTNGPQRNDPKYDEYDQRITNWVEEVCPLP